MSTHDLEPPLPSSPGKLPEASAQLQTNLLQDEDPGPVRTMHGFKWLLAYSSLLSTVLFYALDGTIVSCAFRACITFLTVHRLQPFSLR